MGKKIISIILLSCFTCDVFCNPEMSTLVRKKRWGEGDMGTGDLSNMFRGTAGVDYPDLKSIPVTAFRCEDQTYEGGLYADVETRCQVYHVCHDGRKDSFMCGKGTIFNQQILACDYWYSAECDSAPSYYYLNSQIGNAVSPNNPQDNYQDHRDNNPQISGGVHGSGDNRKGPYAGGYDKHYEGHNQQTCQCLKSSNIRPWSFPSGMMQGNDK